jgi:hypothetical protein
MCSTTDYQLNRPAGRGGVVGREDGAVLAAAAATVQPNWNRLDKAGHNCKWPGRMNILKR